MSRVLLDTHLLLWWLKDDQRLPDVLVSELQTDRHTVWISQASFWELAINVNLGRLLVCQSRAEPLLLFTCDQALAAYGSCVRVFG